MKAIIIDDEPKARNLLEILIKENCPKITTVFSAEDLLSGVALIKTEQPQIVFLDIEMPQHSGLEIFDFLDTKDHNFEIIFTTAYSEYAIQAFELSAIDYLLKPLRAEKLKEAVNKAIQNIGKTQINLKLEELRKSLTASNFNKIGLPVADGIKFVNFNSIIMLAADGMYTNVSTVKEGTILVSKPLKFFVEILQKMKTFYRPHRSHLINLSYIKEYIKKEVESYGILKITTKGKEFIDKPYQITLFKERDYSTSISGEIIKSGKDNVMDAALFAMLKDLVKTTSKKLNIPPFAIFQEPSLHEMCMYYPSTQEQLKNIAGVGQGKARRFGEPFLGLINRYVEENNIERPSDFVVKSVANKSAMKINIITNIDKKNNLEDISSQNKITFDELITEIETIVHAGTKININYYIDEMLEEDEQQEIFDYFMEAESDSIDIAYNELDEEYEEEEIRLMRIRFMSEVAN